MKETKEKSAKFNIFNLIVLLFKGALVGFGAIMPGISGGTLCVAFGMYQPIMNLLSHPFKELRKNGVNLFFFILGGGLGFIGLSGLAALLLEKDSTAMICAFIGFIIGTIPDLWHDAGKQGRKNSSYISMAVGFAVLLAILLSVKNASGITVNPDIWGFLICGVLWGLSFVVPGLSSSTLIIFIGLYQPMLDGISSLSMKVLIPLAIGAGACLLALPRVVNMAFDKWYSQLSHAIIGIVIASTVTIIPTEMFASTKSILLGVMYIVIGAVVSFFLTKLCNRLVPEEK